MVRVVAWIFPLLLPACGSGSGGGPTPAPSATPSPAPTPSPSPGGELPDQAIDAAAAAIVADTCLRLGGGNCAWTDRAYSPAEFEMASNSDEAILIIDDFPRLPVRTIRFRKHIKGYHRLGIGGTMVAAATSWRIPSVLWDVLDRFSGPSFTPSQKLKPVGAAANESYKSVTFDNVGHGSAVFSLIADNSPRQPLVILDLIKLEDIAPADYCDVSGSGTAQASLLRTAQRAADAIVALIRANNVRYINYSAGHRLQSVRDGWQTACNKPVPTEDILREKLAAYAPIYAALFGTPGVLTVQAGTDADSAVDAPYDQRGEAYYNRLRIGYFTALVSGVDETGRGAPADLRGWPSRTNADLFVNTGVQPERPFAFNRTPLLQSDGFSTALFPITGPQTSWVAPLALARMVHLRFAKFGDRRFDDQLIADIFDAATPSLCPGHLENRCVFQDPMLHGQTEAVRLGYRSREFTGL